MTPNISIIAAYNYMLLKLAIRYVKNDRDKFFGTSNIAIPPISLIDSLKKFNSENDFNYQKVSLFPFLVCVANGRESKEKMLKFFNYEEFQFKASPYGVVHSVIQDYLSELYAWVGNSELTYPTLVWFIKKSFLEETLLPEADKSKVLKFFVPQDLLTKKSLITVGQDPTKELQEFVVNYFIDDKQNNDESELTTEQIREDLRSILNSIDYCINFLHDKRLERFVNRDTEYISSMSSNNSSYRMYRALISKVGDNKLTKEYFVNSLKAEYFSLT